MTRTLQVTQADIDKSRKLRTASTLDRQLAGYNNERDCPIGVALARTFNAEREMVRAHPDFLSIASSNWNKGYAEHWRATQVIRDFMRQWDRFGRAEPHNFKLLDY